MERLIIGIERSERTGEKTILVGKCEGIITSCINHIEGPMAEMIELILKGEVKTC